MGRWNHPQGVEYFMSTPRTESVEAQPYSQNPTVTSDDRLTLIDRVLALAGVDFPAERRKPQHPWLAVAVATSIVGSLAADALLVAIGTTLFPGTKGYEHFRLSDYGRLTVIGVVIACVAWPIVTRISSSPRWLFFRLAILVTLFLWLPDMYILYKGQPATAVAVLMVMHLAIALVTYNALVRLAPAHRRFRRADNPSSE